MIHKAHRFTFEIPSLFWSIFRKEGRTENHSGGGVGGCGRGRGGCGIGGGLTY